MGSRRLLTEAFLGEATLEVPEGDTEAMKRVLAGAIKRRALPLSAASWWVTKPAAQQQRRATDRKATSKVNATDSNHADADAMAAHDWPGWRKRGDSSPDSPVTSKRTGRTVPATNRFVQAAHSDPKLRPQRVTRGRNGDAEDFPDFDAPPSAATDVGYPSDDRILSRGLSGRPDDGSIDVPEPGGGRNVRTIKPASKAPGGFSSISNLFKRRPPDGRRQLDKALKSADRDAQRRSGKQGTLGRLVRGRDVTR